MSIPFFYVNQINTAQNLILLDEDTSRHVVQVLRMKVGEQLSITDGKGQLIHCIIEEANKKHCAVRIQHTATVPSNKKEIIVAISLLKNANRFEWFLEKATEIGVTEIIPMICTRTEREKFRHDRMNAVCISAMLQSQQCWLPILHQPVVFQDVVDKLQSVEEQFIAHCYDEKKNELAIQIKKEARQSCILIGPEGDFTQEEVELALKNNFQPVSLGDTRLRTETAGVVAAVLLAV